MDWDLSVPTLCFSVKTVTYQNHPENQSGAGRLQSWNPSWAETRSEHPADS